MTDEEQEENSFGKFIFNRRKVQLKLGLREAAGAMLYSAAWLSKVENGVIRSSRVSESSLRSLAIVLQLDPDLVVEKARTGRQVKFVKAAGNGRVPHPEGLYQALSECELPSDELLDLLVRVKTAAGFALSLDTYRGILEEYQLHRDGGTPYSNGLYQAMSECELPSDDLAELLVRVKTAASFALSLDTCRRILEEYRLQQPK